LKKKEKEQPRKRKKREKKIELWGGIKGKNGRKT